ncbi:MAG: hypothetical protein K2X77_16490 [Candidatus Obscuribacterales bacterium]|nr:hypothetical protein [Candidatus Obscuribacterales bacterium]
MANEARVESHSNTAFDRYAATLPKEEQGALDKMFHEVAGKREDEILKQCKPTVGSMAADFGKATFNYATGKDGANVMEQVLRRVSNCTKNTIGAEVIKLHQESVAIKH